MKKNIKFYILFWLTLVAVFNAIAFISVGWGGQEKYTPAFWCGYGFIILSFVVNMACSAAALSGSCPEKAFYNISFFRTGYTGLILAFVVGGLFMLIPTIPQWVCILICIIVSGSNTIALIKTRAAAVMVTTMDEKISDSTKFIKVLTADAESLIATAKTPETRQIAEKVYEAVRFSDPVSNEELKDIEDQMCSAMVEFTKAILSGDENAAAVADNLLYLIDNRNKKCAAYK